MIISVGSLLVCMLCRSWSVTVFGNTPSMSRNSAKTTFPCLHAWHMVDSRRWRESVVDLPGQPPKCVLGRRLWVSRTYDTLLAISTERSLAVVLRRAISVKTGSSRPGTDKRGKCDNVGLSAACPSNGATIRSVVVAVAWAKADRVQEWLQALSCVRQHESTRVRVEPEGFGIRNEVEKGQRERGTEIREVS